MVGCPPACSAVEYFLLRRGIDDLPRAGADRPFLAQVEVLECRPVLSFENVFWNNVDADVVFIGHKKEKSRRRDLEIDYHSIRIGRRGLINGLLHVDTPAHFGAEIAQGVEGVGDVLGAEWRAVAPSDAGAGFDR